MSRKSLAFCRKLRWIIFSSVWAWLWQTKCISRICEARRVCTFSSTSNLLTPSFLTLLISPSFASLISFAFRLTGSSVLELGRDNRQLYSKYRKSSLQAQCILALLQPARSWLTCPNTVSFEWKIHTIYTTNSCVRNSLVRWASQALCFTISSNFWSALKIEGAYGVCEE